MPTNTIIYSLQIHPQPNSTKPEGRDKCGYGLRMRMADRKMRMAKRKVRMGKCGGGMKCEGKMRMGNKMRIGKCGRGDKMRIRGKNAK